MRLVLKKPVLLAETASRDNISVRTSIIAKILLREYFCYNCLVKKTIIFAIMAIVLALWAVLALGNSKNPTKETQIFKINDQSLAVEIADSEPERVRGLSGREALPEDAGLLFVFEQEGFHGIWMKEMRFPIDIAWLDREKKIIHIETEVSVETYPKIFNAAAPSLYVLEAAAGVFEKMKIKIGERADF